MTKPKTRVPLQYSLREAVLTVPNAELHTIGKLIMRTDIPRDISLIILAWEQRVVALRSCPLRRFAIKVLQDLHEQKRISDNRDSGSSQTKSLRSGIGGSSTTSSFEDDYIFGNRTKT